jgi:hypothetical protein
MTGNENDRDVDGGVAQLELQIKAAQAGHPDVEDETGWGILAFGDQEVLCRTESLDAKTYRADKTLQPFANHAVVIDDENNRVRFFHAAEPPAPGKVN